MEQKEYFHIELEILPHNNDLFPFHIYLFNPVSKQYSPYLFGNSPMTKEKRSFLKYVVSKGAIVAISISQKNTFLKASNLKEENIPDLSRPKLHKLQVERLEHIEHIENNPPSPFSFKEDINSAIDEDNFMDLITRVKNEVLMFKVTSSHTISLARFFCEQLMNFDNEINRTVTLSYLFAKQNNMDSENILADIICAAFLHHTGITQLDRSSTVRPYVEQFDQEKKDYHKHPGLTQHLTKKCGIKLTENCVSTILEHHERFSGNGYPHQKMGHSILPAALIIGAISHIIDYSSGKINGNKHSIHTVLKKIKNKSIDTGLEFDFGDTIDKNIDYLVTNIESNLKLAA